MPDTFTYIPSEGSSGTMTPRTLKAQFGDGYSQTAADGIFGMLRTWEVMFEPIKAVGTSDIYHPTLEDINDFLTAQGGYKKFLWTQPKPFDQEGPKLFICRTWSFVRQAGLIAGLRATFEMQPT